MASKKVGITAAWFAVSASTAMLAVPMASGTWRVSGPSAPATATAVADDRCDVGRPWTHVPADSREPGNTPVATEGDLPSTILVSVPRTAVLRVDGTGRVVAAWTNTGCPPRPGDDIWLEHPDGALERTTDRILVAQRWIGDFADAGVFERQTTGSTAPTH